MTKKKKGRKSSVGSSSKRSSRREKSSPSLDSSMPDDDVVANSCPHMDKAVCLGDIKKRLKQHAHGSCEICYRTALKQGGQMAAESSLGENVWLCLACGYQGCGRSSDQQHALKHHDSPRTGVSHALVISLETGQIWCYSCDSDIVDVDASPKLREAVQHIHTHLIAKWNSNVKMPKSATSLSQSASVEDYEPARTKPSRGAVKRPRKIASSSSQCQIKGLMNLGNTCFFNSVLQSLMQTEPLAYLLRAEVHRTDLVFTIPAMNGFRRLMNNHNDIIKLELDPPGSLAQSLIRTFEDYFQPGSAVYNPGNLFGQISRKVPRFRGFAQQDSHELLIFLLDFLRTEELRRLKSSILSAFKGHKKGSELEGELTELLKRLHSASFVDRVFGGTSISCVRCLECEQISVKVESFCVISLPIVDKKALLKRSLFRQRSPHSLLSRRNGSKLRSKSKEVDASEPPDPDDPELDEPGEDGAERSKHQLKKERKASKKAAKNTKSKRSSGHNINEADNIPTNGNIENGSPEDFACAAAPPAIRHLAPSDADRLTSGLTDDALDCFADAFQMLEIVDPYSDETPSNSIADSPSPSNDSSRGDDDKDETEPEPPDDPDGGGKEEDDEEGEEGSRKSEGGLDMNELLSEEEKSLAMEPIVECASQKWRTDCSLGTSLLDFIALEALSGKSAYACENCGRLGEREAGVSGGSDLPSDDDSEDDQSTTRCSGFKRRASNFKQSAKRGLAAAHPFKFTKAHKRVLMFSLPPVLILHLKRFEQSQFSLRKASRAVEFPFLLDMTPFCSKLSSMYKRSHPGTRFLYSLYAVVEHSGRLNSGHYVAFVKVRAPDADADGASVMQANTVINQFLPKSFSFPEDILSRTTLLTPDDGDGDDVDARSASDYSLRNRTCNDHHGVDIASPDHQDDDCTASPDSPEISVAQSARDDEPMAESGAGYAPRIGQWYYASDSHVAPVPEAKVLAAQAYLLFYERIM